MKRNALVAVARIVVVIAGLSLAACGTHSDTTSATHTTESWEVDTATDAPRTGAGTSIPAMIPVHFEADVEPDTLIGTYTVDELRIICGFGLPDGLQVVEVAATGAMGYAPVSDANCPTLDGTDAGLITAPAN